MFKMRLVSSDHCQICMAYRAQLDAMKYDYEVFNADDKTNGSQLDAWLITKFPVVQIVEILDNGNRVVRSQWPQGQTVGVRFIDFKRKQLEEKKKIQEHELKSRTTKSG